MTATEELKRDDGGGQDASSTSTAAAPPGEQAGWSASASAPEEYPPSTGAQYGSVEPHVFTHPARAEYWRKVYGEAEYECRHRFDPSFRWSRQGEVSVKRKVITDSLPLFPISHYHLKHVYMCVTCVRVCVKVQ